MKNESIKRAKRKSIKSDKEIYVITNCLNCDVPDDCNEFDRRCKLTGGIEYLSENNLDFRFVKK